MHHFDDFKGRYGRALVVLVIALIALIGYAVKEKLSAHGTKKLHFRHKGNP